MNRGVALRVSKNAIALLTAQVGTRVLALLLSAQLTRSVGVEGLGRYLLVMTVEGIALAVTDLGLNVYALREFSRDPARTERLLASVLVVKAGAALLGVMLLNGVMPWVWPGRRDLLALGSLALVPDALGGALGAVLKARQRMEVSSGFDLGGRALAAIAGVALLRLGFDERAVLVAYAVGRLAVLAAYAGVVWRWRIRPHWRIRPQFAAALTGSWEMLKDALPFAVAGLVAILYRRLDLLMLATWQGDLQAGVYGAAYRLWDALGLVPSSLLDALFPELARRSADRAWRAGLHGLIRRGRVWLLALLGGLLVPGLIVAPGLLTLLYGDVDGIASAPGLFRILLLALPFTYLMLLNGHVLYALGKQRQVSIWMVLATVVNGLLNAWLIPRWGMWAAAWVTLSSEIVLFLALRLAAHRALHGVRDLNLEGAPS